MPPMIDGEKSIGVKHAVATKIKMMEDRCRVMRASDIVDMLHGRGVAPADALMAVQIRFFDG